MKVEYRIFEKPKFKVTDKEEIFYGNRDDMIAKGLEKEAKEAIDRALNLKIKE